MDINDKHNISGAQFTQPPEEIKIRSATSGVSYDFEDALPPAGAYVGVDDNLFVSAESNLVGQNLTVNIRILGLDGLIHPLKFTVVGAGPYVIVRQNFQLMEGYLLSVSVEASQNFQERSATYAVASLVRAPNTQTDQYFLLCSGYVFGGCPICWPSMPPRQAFDGNGFITDQAPFAIGAPAAGNDISFTNSNPARLQIRCISALLTTSAVAGNRLPSLVFDDNPNVYAMIPSGNTQVTGQAVQYTWADSCPQALVFDNKVIAPLPSGIIITNGHRIRTITTGILAGDVWSNVFMLGHYWIQQL